MKFCSKLLSLIHTNTHKCKTFYLKSHVALLYFLYFCFEIYAFIRIDLTFVTVHTQEQVYWPFQAMLTVIGWGISPLLFFNLKNLPCLEQNEIVFGKYEIFLKWS